MFEDLVKAVQQHVADRLVSPLFGAFAVSWGLWNYKFIVILLSEEPVRRSFEMIDTLAYPHSWSFVVIGLVFPLLTALAYIFLYPYPAKFVYEFTRARQKELLDIKRKIEDETPLTVEESRRLRMELVRAEQSFYEQLEKKDQEIGRLRGQLDSLLSSQAQIQEERGADFGAGDDSDQDQVTDEQIQLLRLIGEHSSGVAKRDIPRQGRSQVEVDFDVGELRGLGLIEQFNARVNGTPVAALRLTHEGRRIVVRSAGKS